MSVLRKRRERYKIPERQREEPEPRSVAMPACRAVTVHRAGDTGRYSIGKKMRGNAAARR